VPNGRPWFKFWVADWCRETRFFSAEECGYLIRLQVEAWQSDPPGTLPADPDQLWRFAGAKSRKRFEALSKRVMQSFVLNDERYISKQLAPLYAEIEAIGCERRIAGTLGAKKRWQPNGKRMANAITLPEQTDGDTDSDENREETDPDSEKSKEGRLAPRSAWTAGGTGESRNPRKGYAWCYQRRSSPRKASNAKRTGREFNGPLGSLSQTANGS